MWRASAREIYLACRRGNMNVAVLTMLCVIGQSLTCIEATNASSRSSGAAVIFRAQESARGEDEHPEGLLELAHRIDHDAPVFAFLIGGEGKEGGVCGLPGGRRQGLVKDE